jgi:hypothetical protein
LVLRERWAQELARIDEAPAPAASVRPGGAAGRAATRGSWYVYVEEGQRRYAVKLPPSIGGHPALGFEPLTDPDLPVLPALVRIRQLTLVSGVGGTGPRRVRTVPVGTPRTLYALLRGEATTPLTFGVAGGGTATFTVHGGGGETGRAAWKRARLTGGAAPRRLRDLLPGAGGAAVPPARAGEADER